MSGKKEKTTSKMGNKKTNNKTENNKIDPAKQTTTEYVSGINQNLAYNLNESIDGSTRLFGVPHQFLSYNDPRIGDKSNLGRCFSERLILEAPMVCLKPGIPSFLPNVKDSKREGVINGLIAAANGGNVNLPEVLAGAGVDNDDVLYYDIKDSYSEMMSKVNIMCKMMAVFLGLNKTQVPWASNGVTFGNYDWRYYSFKNIYNDVNFKIKETSNNVMSFINNVIDGAEHSLMTDNNWLRFYVDANSSFSESATNSSSSSILESYTEKLEGIAKELDTISGMAGTDVQQIAGSAASSLDQFIQDNASSGPFGTILKRLSGNTSQIISGGNFLIPEIWSDSEYDKNYSFTISLSTPYGCTESWYLNIGVPLCHILGICLPQQLTANTYKSPYLVKCYSPGWFNCNYGIINSVSIDKGNDNSWTVGGLPNEIKISLSVKDLYSKLSLPVDPYNNFKTFLSTGMLEFLMVNCGVDIISQNPGDRWEIWKTILYNNITDRITSKPYEIQSFFKQKYQSLFNIKL